jgi:aminoglycoside phosphotransferase (APT) family kinase protein
MRQSTRREVYRLSSVSANEPFISANICWCDCRARKRTLRKWKRNIAVIDFGSSSVGDPACDWSIAWTLFEGESREAFRAALPVDNEAWVRGRGWTLWKALIVIAGLPGTNPIEVRKSRRVMDEVVSDHRQGSGCSSLSFS